MITGTYSRFTEIFIKIDVFVTSFPALPDGWYRIGAKLIKLFSERRTWEQAQQFCQSIGGELLSIDSENEYEPVYNLLLGQVKPSTTGDCLRIIYKVELCCGLALSLVKILFFYVCGCGNVR